MTERREKGDLTADLWTINNVKTINMDLFMWDRR